MSPSRPLLALLLPVLVAFVPTQRAPAGFDAQIKDADSIQPYEITFGNEVVGHWVVVSEQSTQPPRGFTPGREYVTWTSGWAWPDSFQLQAVPTFPALPSPAWDGFRHCEFDLETVVSIPEVVLDRDDRLYEVRRPSAAEPPDYELVAWMWLQDPENGDATWVHPIL